MKKVLFNGVVKETGEFLELAWCNYMFKNRWKEDAELTYFIVVDNDGGGATYFLDADEDLDTITRTVIQYKLNCFEVETVINNIEKNIDKFREYYFYEHVNELLIRLKEHRKELEEKNKSGK